MLSLRQAMTGTHTHWASPYWELTVQTFDNNTVTTVHILNLSNRDANVTVRFNGSDGAERQSLRRLLRPRERQSVQPEVSGGGWVEILSDRPIAPSGFVSKDQRSPHVKTQQAVAFPMIFFPMFD